MSRGDTPTLPAQDPDSDARRRALERARDAYQYDTSYEGLPFLKSLPLSELFPPRYLAKGAEVTTRLHANRAASTVSGWTREEAAAIGSELHALAARGDGASVAARRAAVGRRGSAAIPRSADAWAEMFPLLPEPASLRTWREDWCFAWQRLAGPAPVLIRRCDALPPSMPIGDADLARVLPGARLADALSRGRVFVADYAVFEGVPAGLTDGAQKHLWAPIVLFVADPSLRGGLAPIAIQTAGARGDATTLYRPGDRDWMIARTVAQIADENLQGVLVHLGWCHMIVQRFVFAAHRQLAPTHPLAVLFAPHFEVTLAVNQVARESVVDPGGVQDRLLAPVLEQQMSLLRESVGAIDLASLDPSIDFARRGVADREALTSYPFRDDSLPLWGATRTFVDRYLRLYYASDADVAGDLELAAFVREIGAPDAGDLPRLVEGVSPRTIGQVVDLAARVIFRATTYHAAINDSNYDWAGFVPGVPTAAFAPLPPRGAGEDAIAAMLPSVELGWETITATWQVAQLAINRLGDYPRGHFTDPRVAPLVEDLQATLTSIESTIEARNLSRPIPYDYLLPSRITASINA